MTDTARSTIIPTTDPRNASIRSGARCIIANMSRNGTEEISHKVKIFPVRNNKRFHSSVLPVSGLSELFGPSGGEQRVDELVQIPVHHGVQSV